jgi:hypothetical protein
MPTTLFRGGDRRRGERRDTWQPVLLRDARSEARVSGTLLDISGRGALVRLGPGSEAPAEFTLVLRLGDHRHEVRARRLAVEPSHEGSLVHIRFEAVEPALLVDIEDLARPTPEVPGRGRVVSFRSRR